MEQCVRLQRTTTDAIRSSVVAASSGSTFDAILTNAATLTAGLFAVSTADDDY